MKLVNETLLDDSKTLEKKLGVIYCEILLTADAIPLNIVQIILFK